MSDETESIGNGDFMKFMFIDDLENFLAQEYHTAAISLVPERPPEGMFGDLTVNCFRLAKPLGGNPMRIASQITEWLRAHPDIREVECIKAFVNIGLKPAAVFRDSVADAEKLMAAARIAVGERCHILIEYSAPNTNKPQHLGHVRNNTLGQATVALLRKVGHQVSAVNLVNDRGIHICKSMLAYQRWGGGITPEAAGLKGDHLVGNFYVRFDTELRRQLRDLRQTRPELAEKTDDELFLETEIGRAAQQMLVAWEQNAPAVRELWHLMNAWVLDGFKQTYRRMGIEFDRIYFESETYTLGRDLITEHLGEDKFRKREDGAIVIDLDKEKLGSKVVLRSDGTSVYVTQDIGTTVLKQRDFSPDQQVWIVGDEQIFHFKVLFAILARLGYDWAEKLAHMPYGMVNLPSGRMKSREGTVVDADDLFDEMEALARAATLERAETTPDDIDQRARVIGMGALKFMLLKVNPKTTIMFDPEASVKFEGDTGPYVLYAYARIASMLRKAEETIKPGEIGWHQLGTPEEIDLALRCAEYGPTIQRAAQELDSSNLAAYLLDLAKSFSRFYRECPVITAPTPELQRARLELSRRVQMILKDGLDALTIETLESM